MPGIKIELKYCNIIFKYTSNQNYCQILIISHFEILHYIYVIPLSNPISLVYLFVSVSCIGHYQVQHHAYYATHPNPLADMSVGVCPGSANAVDVIFSY